MKRILRKLFPSVFPATEYVASSAEGLPCMLKCVAIVDGKRIELPQQPLFLGYKPLVMGICDRRQEVQVIADAEEITLEYLNIISGKKIAELKLRRQTIIHVETKLLILFVGNSGKQHLESFWDRCGFRANELFSRKSSANIALTPAEYDQLKIAYSVPRSIRMLHVYKGRTHNAFPVDLFGWIGMAHFVLSLRHEKKSAQQVSDADAIKIYPVNATQAAATYASGRFHSADMAPSTASAEANAGVDLKSPQFIGDFGVHRIFLFSTGPHFQTESEESDKLVHVHRSYANWHKRQGFTLKEIPR